MRILTERVATFSHPDGDWGTLLTFDDGSKEFDLYGSQTTAILTAELANGRAAKDDNGHWVPAPGPRNHQWEGEIVGFKVGLTYWQHDGEGKAIFHYSVTTPTGVDFHGDSLCVPPHWEYERIAAEAILWVCVSTDDGVEPEFFADYNQYQLTWRDSVDREYASAEIDEYIENLDKPEREPQMETTVAVDLDAIAKRYVEQYIYACQTSIVEHLLSGEGGNYLEWDNITNFYPEVDSMDALELAEYISDYFGNDWRDLIDITDYIDDDDNNTQFVREMTRSNLDPRDLNEWDIELLRNEVRDNMSATEIYEWWLVDSWLAQELENFGYCILSDRRNHWWGRTTTGQAIWMDGVLQKIAAKYNS